MDGSWWKASGLSVVAVTALVGCGTNARETAAREVYDACVNPDASINLLQHEGDTVSVVVEGDAARALAGSQDEFDSILDGTASDPEDGALTGIGVSIALISGADCLVEETDYPGTSDQLTDGDEWDGWTFTEESGAGSAFTLSFTATG